MHPIRRIVTLHQAKAETLRADRLDAARDFLVGWAAGLIFFWTMLS